MSRTGGSERRAQLVAEAIRSFGTRGYDAATLDDVAEAVGVRKQSLLYYFPTKEALFEACVGEVAARLAATLEQALEGVDDDAPDHPERVIRAIFKLAHEWPDFPGFVREASWRGSNVIGRFAAMLDPLRKRALTYLERGMGEGRFRRQDPVLLLFTIYTAVVGSITEAGVLRAVGGRTGSRAALRKREEELIVFVRAALEP
jgi:TetR/AcrR family transcriptional regulator